MSAASKLASLNAGLLRFCIQHSDFTAVSDPSKLPQRPQEDYDWLQNALENFESDIEKIKKLLEVLRGSESSTGQLLSAFEELEYLVEDLDNAQTLVKQNGVQVIVDLLQHSEPDVRAWAAQLVTVCTHNLAVAQLAFIQSGALARLIVLLKTETNETVRHKVIGAISSITSNNPTGEAFFIQMNGLKVLANFLVSSTSASTRTRIIFFLTRLTLNHPDIVVKLTSMNFIEPIVAALIDENIQLRETAEKALLWILNHPDNVEYAKVLKLGDIVEALVSDVATKKKALSDASKDENENEIERLQDELQVLGQIKAKV
jgi:nucleotide exchange factor SIL1